MVRVLIAAVLGGVLLHAWSFVSWMVLGWHDPTFNDLGDPATEDALVALIEQADLKESGWYYWPAMPDDWQDQQAMQRYTHRHASMPVGHLIVAPAGLEPMPPKTIAIAGATNFGIALVASLLVALAAMRGLLKRWAFVVGLGVLVVLASDAMSWNWMRFPTDFSVAMAIDRVIGMALAGIPIALLVAPQAGRRPAEKN